MYDYLIVGAGLFGSVFACEAVKKGKRCLVIDKRNHIGGNMYTEKIEDINVHKYGAHIFHTNDKQVWHYINSFAEFNRYTNSPIAVYGDEIYNLPFNMNTFSKLWNIRTPEEAKAIIEAQKSQYGIDNPKNLEEQAISLVGVDVYQKLIKEYTAKQWGKSPCDLPAFIIKRLPVRYTYDNNYFNDAYQGIPIGGYTSIFEKMLAGCDVLLNEDFYRDRNYFSSIAKKIIFTGPIDRYFDYCYGKLEYRSLRFETEILDMENYQGNAVVNYTSSDVPYTRIIEHKHFEFGSQPRTVITKEYSANYEADNEPYYPVNDEKNNSLYLRYRQLADKEKNIIFGGRLGDYKYYDMHNVIRNSIDLSSEIII